MLPDLRRYVTNGIEGNGESDGRKEENGHLRDNGDGSGVVGANSDVVAGNCGVVDGKLDVIVDDRGGGVDEG